MPQRTRDISSEALIYSWVGHYAQVWVSFCNSLDLSASPPVSPLAVIRTNHVFFQTWIWKKMPLRDSRLMPCGLDDHIFCITSPYTAPIPLLVILPLPSDRTNTAATARKIGRGTLFPLSPEDQCWVCFMGFMICPFSSWQGCGELGVSSGP